jgi:hypothetical protein
VRSRGMASPIQQDLRRPHPLWSPPVTATSGRGPSRTAGCACDHDRESCGCSFPRLWCWCRVRHLGRLAAGPAHDRPRSLLIGSRLRPRRGSIR